MLKVKSICSKASGGDLNSEDASQEQHLNRVTEQIQKLEKIRAQAEGSIVPREDWDRFEAQIQRAQDLKL